MRYNIGSRGEIVGVLSYSLYTSSSTPYIHPPLLLMYIQRHSLYNSKTGGGKRDIFSNYKQLIKLNGYGKI